MVETFIKLLGVFIILLGSRWFLVGWMKVSWISFDFPWFQAMHRHAPTQTGPPAVVWASVPRAWWWWPAWPWRRWCLSVLKSCSLNFLSDWSELFNLKELNQTFLVRYNMCSFVLGIWDSSILLNMVESFNISNMDLTLLFIPTTLNDVFVTSLTRIHSTRSAAADVSMLSTLVRSMITFCLKFFNAVMISALNSLFRCFPNSPSNRKAIVWSFNGVALKDENSQLNNAGLLSLRIWKAKWPALTS